MKDVHICSFAAADWLTGKKRTYQAVKDAVLAAGMFSVFEATATQKDAALFTKLCAGYPWTGVRRKAAP